MSMQPRYLVLLAAYNGMQWISEQVESILCQDGVDVTLLISVDSSTDGTENWVSNLAESDSRVRYLAHGGKFGGAAKNFFRLINEASVEDFDYFCFADQDDIWLPNKLRAAATLMASVKADGCSGNVTAFWPDGRETLVIKSQPQVEYDHFFEAAGPGCTYVFSRKLFLDMQTHISRRFAEIQNVTLHDWYCYAFSRTHGYKWVIDDCSYMRYRQHANNQVGVNSGLQAFQKRISQVLDGWWLNQAALIARLNEVEGSRFVQSWISLRRLDLIRLALAGSKCRRRTRDKFVFTVLCLALAILRQKK
jgi:rhamnosyltransferase